MNARSILIVGGGTGGHISPGIALYEEFQERGVRVKFLSGRKDERFSSLNVISEGNRFFYGAPTLTKNIFRLPFFALSFLGAVLKARKIIRTNDIGAVIGMGGYVSAPALMAARLTGTPLYLCEQNSAPGRVTVFFRKRARRIYGTFKGSRQYFEDGCHFVQAGNPMRKKVAEASSKDEAKKYFHLSHCTRVILAIGGSQGAVAINELMLELKRTRADELKNIGIIWSTGDLSYEKYKELVHREMEGGSVYLSPFIDRVGLAYMACDLAICRSGAGVMMELAAMGVPSIQIPYPHAAANHQEKNADEFVEGGAAIKIMNSDAHADTVFPVIMDLFHNETKLARMAARARELGRPDAAAVIADDILGDSGIAPAGTMEKK